MQPLNLIEHTGKGNWISYHPHSFPVYLVILCLLVSLQETTIFVSWPEDNPTYLDIVITGHFN